MLAESIIRIGRPLKNGKMSCREKLALLTDCGSTNCKNFFRKVFLVEVGETELYFQEMELGDIISNDGKDDFKVSVEKSVAFPIFYPNGGNPLHAQGIYALPCYLLYDQHIKALSDPAEFNKEFLLPRLKKTLHYRDWPAAKQEALAERIAALLAVKMGEGIREEKQLGIFMLYDAALPVFQEREELCKNDDLLLIGESGLQPGHYLYLDGGETLRHIGRAKFYEAAELGREKQAVSTFTNRTEPEVVSIYNKSWLWLSPTWECPRSIYWADDEWTKGIKLEEESYAAYLYGVNFLKEIQVPVSSSILKEMFAPVTSVEAKKNMKATSFEAIYGIPLVLPLLDGDSQQSFSKYRRMLKKEDKKQSDSDLHLEVLAGLTNKILPDFNDEHRLTILYYSGDLSRGSMHIRAMIEDVIPSVASQIEKILKKLVRNETGYIQEVFGVTKGEVYKTKSLPSLIANAFGPGYVWETLQAVFHKESLRLDRLRLTTARRLNELANREEYWQMMQELVFFYSFLYFWQQYEREILGRRGGVHTLADWNEFRALYGQGKLEASHLTSVEHLGFAAGLLLKQFSNSYYQKTGKEFVKNRVMKFGSKLTPDMIWKDGLLRCEELAQQWSMKLAANFRPVLAAALLGFLEHQKRLVEEKDSFMTAFWSGYLIYKADKKNDNAQENGGSDNE
ncbi:hypothetical protein [Propionispora hippei]|uniref:CRISPR-associated protein Csh1 n=1 Tax=Propionispora hippei DSM 15287 TaxID=1123003 RepID=A0A1M6KU00_9FIRM|nr:hypothetical protein [Propionispora hippei]SHJ62406.1 hypothetical protein SAMN02745170_02953 [Propionispora hippei DSM 15287]